MEEKEQSKSSEKLMKEKAKEEKALQKTQTIKSLSLKRSF